VSKVRDFLVREEKWQNIIDRLLEYERECEQHLAEGTFDQYAETLNDHSKRLILEPAVVGN
jgi:tRNA-dihydrouridine synthase B